MPLFETHHALLEGALQALATRGHWTPFPESPSPKVYGETGQADGQAAVAALLGQDYPLSQPGERGRVATERSPYGVTLDVHLVSQDEALPRADLVVANISLDSVEALPPRIDCITDITWL